MLAIFNFCPVMDNRRPVYLLKIIV